MLLEGLLAGELTWSLPLFIAMISIYVLYIFLVKNFTTLKFYDRKPVLFGLGLVLLFLCIGSPFAVLSHYSFTTHMVQMSVLYFIIPPLLLTGIPARLYEELWKFPEMKTLQKWSLSANITLVLFGMLFLVYHLPITLNVFSHNPVLHQMSMLLLFILSFRIWWPLCNTCAKTSLSEETKKRYAWLSGIVLMPACTLFIFTALIDGSQNPFLHQIAMQICIPHSLISQHAFPVPLNETWDQIAAGTVMLGIHKFAIYLSFRLEEG